MIKEKKVEKAKEKDFKERTRNQTKVGNERMRKKVGKIKHYR